MLPHCIMLIDVDTFDLQILENQHGLEPDDHEARVVEDTWGLITSLNRAAKACGICRNESIVSALEKCPSLRRLTFPVLKTNKPDYKGRRTTTQGMIQCIQETVPSTPLEIASCDEFYLDVTTEVHRRITNNIIPEYDRLWAKTIFVANTTIESDFDKISDQSDLVLMHGALIASQILSKFRTTLHIRASVGVSYNKLMAKLGCGLGKPGGLTVVSQHGGLSQIASKIPISAVAGLGGKAGEVLSARFKTMEDLSLATVDEIFDAGEGKISKAQASSFLATCQGTSNSKVIPTTYFNSVTVSKQFHEGSILTNAELQADLAGLIEELWERLEEEVTWNRRRCRSATVSIKLEDQPTTGIIIPGVASLSQHQFLTTFWTQFTYAHQDTFKLKRIELVIKKFDLL